MSTHSALPADPWLDGEPEPVPYSLGPWSFELRGTSLSNIAYRGAPILRAIRCVVRDRDWQTVESELVGIELDSHSFADAPRLVLRARSRDTEGVANTGGDAVDFEWTMICTITENALDVAVHGRANTDFLRNRIGLIVLHYPSDAGTELTVLHPQAAPETIRLPSSISAHQPARDIAGMRWRTAGVNAEIDLRGDVFEMEDQRNWTDASFKTYSTPLDIPFPVRVHRGDIVEQGLTLRCRTDVPTDGATTSTPTPLRDTVDSSVTLGEPWCVMPEVWVGASTAPGDSDSTAPSAVAGVLVELDTRSPLWTAALQRAASDAGSRTLDVRLIVAQPQAAEAISAVLDALVHVGAARIARLGVFDSATHVAEEALWNLLARGAAERFPRAELVGGTRAHFTELNRNHHRLRHNSGSLSFSLTPQMHDLGRDQVIESIPIQRLVAAHAVQIADGRPVHVGPVTLRSRFNAVATSPGRTETSSTGRLSDGYGAEHVRAATDPRQKSRGYAAWVIASAAAVAQPGIASITYGETWGPRGATSADAREVYPVSTALEWLGQLAGWQLLTVGGGLPEGVSVIAATRGEEYCLLVANLAERQHSVRVDPFSVSPPSPAISTVLHMAGSSALRWSGKGDRPPTLQLL